MKETRIDYYLEALAIALGIAQPELILKYIQFGLGIVATIISIAYSIYKWWKKASADGKITKEEINEGIEEIKKNLKDKD